MAELPAGLFEVSPRLTWRNIYGSWQRPLRLTASHPYYRTLGLHISVDAMRALRREVMHADQVKLLASRAEVARVRGVKVHALASFAGRVAERTAKVQQIETQLKGLGDKGPGDKARVREVLKHKTQQLRTLVSCSGCHMAFSASDGGPRLLDGCSHAVCARCLQRPQCPRCRALVFYTPDPLTQAHASKLCASFGEVAQLWEFQERLTRMEVPRWHEATDRLERQAEQHRSHLKERDQLSRQVVRAYRRLALLHHPDHGGTEKAFQELDEAYKALGSLGSRLEYSSVSHRVAQAKAHNTSRERMQRQAGTRAALTDPRPSMPPMPSLSLVPSHRAPLHGWHIECSWGAARGCEATEYSLELQSQGEDWAEIARVAATGSADGKGLHGRSRMIIDGGLYLVRVTAGNAQGWGPSSVEVAIDVPAAATAAELRAERRQHAEEMRAAEEARKVKHARHQAKMSRRLEERRFSRLRQALENVREVTLELAEPATLALTELRLAMDDVQDAGCCVAAAAVQDAIRLLDEGGGILDAFDALPAHTRRIWLRCARRQRHEATAGWFLRLWWHSGALCTADRERIVSLPEAELTDFIARRLRSAEVASAAHAYAEWRAGAVDGPDELGLVYQRGAGKLDARVLVSVSLLVNAGEGLWNFLEASGMTDPAAHSEAARDDEDSEDSNHSTDPDSEPELGTGVSRENCHRSSIQLLIFGAISERLCAAGVAACLCLCRCLAQGRGASGRAEHGCGGESGDGTWGGDGWAHLAGRRRSRQPEG